MTKLLIFLFTITLTCSCNLDTKHNADKSNVTVVKKPRPYFGDSLLTISFSHKSDTTFFRDFENGGVSEISVVTYSGDTASFIICRDLVAGIYNGACEIKNDTLNLNYWLDSSDCISAMVHSRIVYKIKTKKIDAGKTKMNFIKTNSPLRKHCE